MALTQRLIRQFLVWNNSCRSYFMRKYLCPFIRCQSAPNRRNWGEKITSQNINKSLIYVNFEVDFEHQRPIVHIAPSQFLNPRIKRTSIENDSVFGSLRNASRQQRMVYGMLTFGMESKRASWLPKHFIEGCVNFDRNGFRKIISHHFFRQFLLEKKWPILRPRRKLGRNSTGSRHAIISQSLSSEKSAHAEFF